MKNRFSILAMVAWGVPLLGTAPLNGAVLYSTLGPGNSYDTGTKYAQDGNTGYQAFLFQPVLTGVLSAITVALAQQTPIANQTQFQLYSGDTTTLQTLLESWVVANNTPEPGALVTMTSVLHPVLTAGAHYWLSITEPDAPNGPNSLWYFNNQNLSGVRRTSFSVVPGSTLPAFRVNSSADIDNPVPEPSTVLFAGAGLLVLAAVRRAGRWHKDC